MENTFGSKTYFGAANGYSGFRSNFDKIFSPYKLDKLFIIKGGPGTGKSTLMKKIKSNYLEKAEITTVLCSSDPASFDGLIISKKGVSIGIVDGTAPHVVEPEYPGAIEEIINLGDGFDYAGLGGRKKEILSLSDSKKSSYKRAYKYMKTAGLIYEHIKDALSDYGFYNEAEEQICNLIDENDPSGLYQEKSDYLISSFSKNGFNRLPIISGGKEVISIRGDGVSEYLLMTRILDKLDKKTLSYRVYASAFSDALPDAIECGNTLYTITDEDSSTVDSISLIKGNKDYKNLKSIYDSLINNARLSLAKASEYHFRMEDIYIECMEFQRNEEKYDYIIKSINALFNK